jgi:26S proteasome regulatory subunit N2
MATATLTSASGFIALLDPKEEDALKDYALKQLDSVVDQFWPEIAGSVTEVAQLYERQDFSGRKLAALVASKVFYHLGGLGEAMYYALGAEELFDITARTEFVETLIAKCIDEYVRLRVAASKDDTVEIDGRLEAIVERMFERCFKAGEYRPAIGIALQSRRLDKLEYAIAKSSAAEMGAHLQYTFRVCMDLVSIDYRPVVLRLLVQLYSQLPVPDSLNMCRCLVFLEDAEGLASQLKSLVSSQKEEDVLLAYQIAFELCDNATQQFLAHVRLMLPATIASHSDSGDAVSTRLSTLRRILTNEPTINLFLQFLYRNNHADLGILKAIKASFEPRQSILHNATIVANALMHSGTTHDTFLRDNLDWLGKATNWAKFSTTAGLGVIHKGHLKQAKVVLDPYLPKDGATASPYTEGGSLYALGLIHANHGATSSPSSTSTSMQVDGQGEGGIASENGESITQMLLNQIVTRQDQEVVVHGACLGYGVAAMASGDEEAFGTLLSLISSTDNAIAGEAAGYAMGLVMLGSASPLGIEMLQTAHNTQHDKIIRGLAIGLAMVYYGKEESADPMIDTLIKDKDPILRYGSMFMIGMAYGGTGSNSAIKRLLHIAVSDTNDDVRRAAVMNLGFVLFRQPEQVPKLVSLLAESYNSSVRYGACLAVGIACAGTGSKEAYEMLMPLAKEDSVDMVRQGAMIALAMTYIQINDSRAQELRKHLRERIEDKREPVMCKFGAIIASGILDAGGRNVTLSLRSRTGHKNMQAIVGLVMFLQYWYWYPLLHFISLSFTPTAIIAVNMDLKMPKFQFKSNVPPSYFAYPPEVKVESKKKEVKVVKASLSSTRRVRTGKKKTGAAGGSLKDSMEIDESPVATPRGTGEIPPLNAAGSSMDVDAATSQKDETAAPKPEPTTEVLQNPARVTRAQFRHISYDVDERYRPISDAAYGIIVLRDSKPNDQHDLITDAEPSAPSAKDEEDEPAPPEPFEFLG